MSDYLDKGAVLSECGAYRFRLWRRWAHFGVARGVPIGGTMLFVMLNPSTADDKKPDPTLDRCVGFAKREGFGELRIVNLFALRTPFPSDLAKDWTKARAHEEANLRTIEIEALTASRIVAAWGQNETQGVDVRVLRLLRQYQDVYCLGRNADQTPRHPLYLKNSTPLELYLKRFEQQERKEE